MGCLMNHEPEHAGLSRRAFIGRAAIAAAAFAGAAVVGDTLRRRPTPQLWDASAFAPPQEAHVAVVAKSSYEGGRLSDTVFDGLRAIGADVHGANVVLKPNFVEFDPGSAINTDPRIVTAAVEAVRRLGAASVAVAEGPGHRRDTEYVVRASGLLAQLDDVHASFTDLNTAPASSVRLPTMKMGQSAKTPTTTRGTLLAWIGTPPTFRRVGGRGNRLPSFWTCQPTGTFIAPCST